MPPPSTPGPGAYVDLDNWKPARALARTAPSCGSAKRSHSAHQPMSVGSLCSAGVWPVANPDHVMRWKFGREAEMAAGPFTASPGSKRFDVASAQRGGKTTENLSQYVASSTSVPSSTWGYEPRGALDEYADQAFTHPALVMRGTRGRKKPVDDCVHVAHGLSRHRPETPFADSETAGPRQSHRRAAPTPHPPPA